MPDENKVCSSAPGELIEVVIVSTAKVVIQASKKYVNIKKSGSKPLTTMSNYKGLNLYTKRDTEREREREEGWPELT